MMAVFFGGAKITRFSLKREGTELLFVLALVLLVLLSWLPRTKGAIDLRWDGGAYYVLGTALAEGRGYRLLNEPGEIPAIQYPPLLPTLIAVHQFLLGTSDPVIVGRWLRLTFFLMFTAYILVSYYILRRFLPVHFAFLGMAICLLHLMTHYLSDLCFAEIPYALASVLFVAFNGNSLSYGRSMVAGSLAASAYLFRAAGIALFLGWIAESLAKRNCKQFFLRIAIASLPVVAWQSYIAVVESGPSFSAPVYEYQRADYLFYNTSYARNISLRDPFEPQEGRASFAELADRFLSNLTLIPVNFGEAVSAKKEFWNQWVHKVLGATSTDFLMYLGPGVLGMLVIGGLVLQLARGDVLVPIYVFAYAAAVCLTPWPIQWTRYWAPLTPFLALSLVLCLLSVRRVALEVVSWYGRILTHGALAAVFVVLVLIQSSTLLNFYRDYHPEVQHVGPLGRLGKYPLFYDDVSQKLNRALEWLRVNARNEDIVVSSMPHWAHIQTGLKTVMPPFERDQERAQALLDLVPVRFVIVETADLHPCSAGMCRGDYAAQYLLPLLSGAPERWSLAYVGEDDSLRIYERTNKKCSTLALLAINSAGG